MGQSTVVGERALGLRHRRHEQPGGGGRRSRRAYWYLGTYFNHAPRFLRVGTCFTDEVSARAATWMGQERVSFAINGDAGATYPAGTVYSDVMTSRPGHILISHLNRPGGGTVPGYAGHPGAQSRGTDVPASEPGALTSYPHGVGLGEVGDAAAPDRSRGCRIRGSLPGDPKQSS